MSFKNRYSRKYLTKHESPVGSEFMEVTGWTYEDGEYKHVVKKVTNLYEKIQAARDSVDLHKIMERYEDEGQSALDRVQGMYLDTVDLPKNYAQLYDAVSKANDTFDALPATIKDKFNNNAATFWKNYGRETFDDIVNEYRTEVFSRYGMEDFSPVNTSGKHSDVKTINDSVESEVTSEQKSE